MLHSASVVRRPLHVVMKRHPSKWTSLRGNCVQHHKMAASVARVPRDPDVYSQVENLSASHLTTFIKAARSHSHDLESALEQYQKSRDLISKSYSFSAEALNDLNDSISHLDGQHLDKLFNVESSETPSDCLRSRHTDASLQEITDFLWFSASSLISPMNDDTPQPTLKSSPVAKNLSFKSKKSTPLQNVLLCSSGGPKNDLSDDSDKPSMDVLHDVHDYLVEAIPKMLNQRVDQRIYTNDIVLVNNYNPNKPMVIEGAAKYLLYMSRVRAYMHFKYAKSRLDVVRTWEDVHAGTVRVQWRFAGITQLQAMMFWRFNPWSMQDSFQKHAKILEVISTYHVTKAGQISKHVVDRMMVDGDLVKKAATNPLEKLVKKAAPAPL